MRKGLCAVRLRKGLCAVRLRKGLCAVHLRKGLCAVHLRKILLLSFPLKSVTMVPAPLGMAAIAAIELVSLPLRR